MPTQYLMLLESEIFHATYTSDSTPSELWNKFGQWIGFDKVSNLRKKFRHHCHHIWTKINHAYNLQVEARKNPLELHGILKNSSKKEKKSQKYAPPKLGSRSSGVRLKNHQHSHLDITNKQNPESLIQDITNKQNPESLIQDITIKETVCAGETL
ncbi:10890_t:CDS:2, partial [Cetraspora pellucida]